MTAVCAVVVLLFLSNVLFGRLSEDEKLLIGSVTQEYNGESQSNLNIERSLRVVSYNLWCNYLNVFTNWNVRERIEGLAEGIKDFDIALIQEAYILKTGVSIASRCASILVKAMTKHGFHYRTSIAEFMPPYVLGRSGSIVIFSRIPLTRTASKQFQSYPIQLLPDYRGFVVGEYVVNSRHLYVFNTHLDPYLRKSRTLQAKELTAAIKNFAKLSHVIVSGDFNIDNNAPLSNNSKEYIELLQIMNQAGLRPVFPFRMETNIDGGNYDAMFTSSNIAVEKKDIIKLVTNSKALVSDHFGLAVELKLL